MTDDPAKPPRFPYVGALLCVACLGAAAWTWMRYSYCWSMPLWILAASPNESLYNGRYAAVRDATYFHIGMFDREPLGPGLKTLGMCERELCKEASTYARVGGIKVRVRIDETGLLPSPTRLRGRIVSDDDRAGHLMLDASQGRLHGASIAGLVVGAMGVFVFAVALRHWLGERRKFREEARA